MVYGMNSDLGVDLSDLGVDLPKWLVLLSFVSDGGNMPVIQLIPREGLKSPDPGLDGCLKSLSTHHELENSIDTSLGSMVYTLNVLY